MPAVCPSEWPQEVLVWPHHGQPSRAVLGSWEPTRGRSTTLEFAMPKYSREKGKPIDLPVYGDAEHNMGIY
jgi:hypothetical protein